MYGQIPCLMMFDDHAYSWGICIFPALDMYDSPTPLMNVRHYYISYGHITLCSDVRFIRVGDRLAIFSTPSTELGLTRKEENASA